MDNMFDEPKCLFNYNTYVDHRKTSLKMCKKFFFIRFIRRWLNKKSHVLIFGRKREPVTNTKCLFLVDIIPRIMGYSFWQLADAHYIYKIDIDIYYNGKYYHIFVRGKKLINILNQHYSSDTSKVWKIDKSEICTWRH